MRDALDWFEIPVTDIQRAAHFYGALLDTRLEIVEGTPGYPMASLPVEDGVGGALVRGEGYDPGLTGTVVYLAVADIDVALRRAVAAGGQVLLPRLAIGENGYTAFIKDSEGNKVGLHAWR